jgi:acyl-CoA reductase-like NAD-dependent aldehyde dehydrogenase
MVFKASELCPRTHHLLLELYMEAGVPADVISVVQTRREDAPAVTEALISHPAIRKVEFVGSAPVGRVIGSLAGKYLKPVLMELGGKCATVILEDAKLEDAATKAIAQGSSPLPYLRLDFRSLTGRLALNHHGQVCFSTERIIVLKPVADQFIGLLKQKALEYPPHTGVNNRVVRNAFEMLSEAQDKGAEFILGKPEYLSESSLAPALLTGVTPDMKIWDEETFGPSTTIIVAQSDEEAIRVVNESKYGLEASVFTQDMKRAIEMAHQLEVGRVRINGSSHECRSSGI